MIDTSTPLGRAVAASLRLAEKRDWREISLFDIADEAGLTLAELSRHVSSKPAVLRAFVRLVDDAILRKAERREPEESLRERLFDVLMTRLETMAPYKAALKRLTADATLAPELLGSVMRSQSWMLVAAGIPADGVRGTVRVTGLASVYAATFRDWLQDEDAGLARTMAALDRRLRRGEGWVKSFDSFAASGESVFAGARTILDQAVFKWSSRARTSAAAADVSGQPTGPSRTADESSDRPAKDKDKDKDNPEPGSTGPTSSLH